MKEVLSALYWGLLTIFSLSVIFRLISERRQFLWKYVSGKRIVEDYDNSFGGPVGISVCAVTTLVICWNHWF